MRQPEQRQVFVHIHIPKCGGSTFQTILARNFGRGFYRDRGLLEDYQYNARQVGKIIKAHPWLQAYSAHKISLDLPFDLSGVAIHALTFVRDPAERFISHYFFHRGIAENYAPAAKQLSLQDYIDHALVQGRQQMYINGQTKFLTGQGDAAGLEIIRRHIDQGHLLLLPLHRFDEACLVLERRFPQQFKNCAYVRRNVSRQDQSLSLADRKTIQAYTGYDRELLTLAEQRLNRALLEEYPDAAQKNQALVQFHRRCVHRNRLDRVRQIVIQPVIRLARRLYPR